MKRTLTEAQAKAQLTRLNSFIDTLKAEQADDLNDTLTDIGSGSLKSMFDKETSRRK